MKKKVVIIGGGFGGIAVAKSLKKSNFEITLIDKTNHHLFQPLLYQVATAALSPGDIAVPIRSILQKQKNIKVILGEVTNINKNENIITLKDNTIMSFDYLVIAIGARHSYFGNEDWEKDAPGLKTISDALGIREKILYSFEQAEKINDKELQKKYMTFSIVGAGPTGVEMAGAIAEIAKKTMLNDFRNIDPSETKIILFEGGDRVLSMFHKDLSKKAFESLTKLGVDVRLKARVSDISNEGLIVNNEKIACNNIIWAAGNKAPKVLETLETNIDRSGRVIVEKDLSISDNNNIFVIGDCANFSHTKNNNPLPGIAPVAMQQGKYIGKLIAKEIGKKNRGNFSYLDKGSMATIGKAKAIADIKGLRLSGFIAWLMWSLIHVMFLIDFRNKAVVMSEWIWYYLFSQRNTRLITRVNRESK